MSVAATPASTYGRMNMGEETPMGAKGRLRQYNLKDSDRNYCLAMHLATTIMFVTVWPFCYLAPIIMWAIRKDTSPFIDDHGREIMNYMLSYTIWFALLAITVVGLILWPVLFVVMIVNAVRGSIASSNGEYFRYPMTLRFFS